MGDPSIELIEKYAWHVTIEVGKTRRPRGGVWRGPGMDARADAVLPALRAVAGYVALLELDSAIDNSSVAKAVHLHRLTAQRYLGWLTGAGVLERYGYRRYRYIVRAFPPGRWLPV